MQKQIISVIGGILVLLHSQLSMATLKNDVVKISMPNKTAIEIVGEDINKYPIDTSFISESIERFFNFCLTSNIAQMMQQAPRLLEIKVVEDRAQHYTYGSADKFYSLNINERQIPNQIISSAGFTKNLYYLQKHQLEFSDNRFTYKIMFDELEQLYFYQTLEAAEVLTGILHNHLKEKSRHIEKLHYEVEKDYGYEKIYQNEKYANDQIELSFSPGFENVKNSWAGSIEAVMTFSFSRKGINKNAYSLHYEWQYDFSSDNERNINQFVSIGYRHDFSKDPDNSKSYTFKLGYLAYKQRNLYSNDTFRLGVSRGIGSKFTIEPQIYFNDFFQDVIPSIKLGIGF